MQYTSKIELAGLISVYEYDLHMSFFMTAYIEFRKSLISLGINKNVLIFCLLEKEGTTSLPHKHQAGIFKNQK